MSTNKAAMTSTIGAIMRPYLPIIISLFAIISCTDNVSTNETGAPTNKADQVGPCNESTGENCQCHEIDVLLSDEICDENGVCITPCEEREDCELIEDRDGFIKCQEAASETIPVACHEIDVLLSDDYCDKSGVCVTECDMREDCELIENRDGFIKCQEIASEAAPVACHEIDVLLSDEYCDENGVCVTECDMREDCELTRDRNNFLHCRPLQ